MISMFYQWIFLDFHYISAIILNMEKQSDIFHFYPFNTMKHGKFCWYKGARWKIFHILTMLEFERGQG